VLNEIKGKRKKAIIKGPFTEEESESSVMAYGMCLFK